MSFIKYLVITISIVNLLSAQLVHAKGQGLLNLADIIKTSGSITDESFILPSDIDILNEIISSATKRMPFPFYYHNHLDEAAKRADEILLHGYSRRTIPPFDITKPLDWGQSYSRDNEWQVEINAFFHIDPILQTYLETGDEKYVDIARNAMLDWIDFNITRNQHNRYKWHDITTGIRAFYLAWLIDHDLRTVGSDKDSLIMMISAAYAHANVLANPHMFSHMANHVLFVILGLSAISKAIPEMIRSGEYFDLCLTNMMKFITAQYGEEAIHLENSPYYHAWVYHRLNRILNLGWFNKNPFIQEYMKSIQENMVYLFRPNGILSRIGDSSPTTAKIEKNIHPYVQYVATSKKEGVKPASSDMIFPKTGYVIFRSDWDLPLNEQSYLFVNAAFHTATHKHADDFTFEWFAKGHDIVVDSGKYSYDKNETRDYVLSTRAHNTVEIDQKNIPRNRELYGSALNSWGIKHGIKYAEMEVKRAEADVTHKRTIFLKPNHWLLIVDELDGKTEHDYTQWFHFNSTAKLLNLNGQTSLAFDEIDNPLFILDFASEKSAQKIFKGATKPRMQGWVSPGYQKIEPNYAIGLDKRGENVKFITLLSFVSGDPPPVIKKKEISPFNIEVCWTESSRKSEGIVFKRKNKSPFLSLCSDAEQQ